VKNAVPGQRNTAARVRERVPDPRTDALTKIVPTCRWQKPVRHFKEKTVTDGSEKRTARAEAGYKKASKTTVGKGGCA